MTSPSGANKTVAIINVTPMIDILLVLLIVFMLLPSHTHGLKSELPQPAPENATAPPDPQQVVVRIQDDGSIQVNSQPVAREQLEARLQSLFAVRPEGVLFVDGGRELEFADVASVIDMARGVGVNRIGLLTASQH